MPEAAPIDLGFRPRAHQFAAFQLAIAFRFLVLVWHRRAGKTVFAVMMLIRSALVCARPRGRFAYIAPLRDQAKRTVWDLYLKPFTRAIPGVKYNESELTCELGNGAKISLFGADNPDALRGLYFDGVVLDEVAQHRENVWGEILRPALEDREGWAIFIGTPHGYNQFHKLYADGLKVTPGWKSHLLRASDSDVFRPDQLDAMRREMSEQEYAQELECDFSAAVTNALLRADLVQAAMQRHLPETAYEEEPKLLGVDVARQGGDRSVIFPRQGLAAFRPTIHRIANLMDLADTIAQTAQRWEADYVFIDATGMGWGVYDRLLQLGVHAIPVDFGARALRPDLYANRRAEMWWKMAEWVKAGAALPNDPDVLLDLTTPEYDYRNARDRLALESKDDVRKRHEKRRSPDTADALATTFAVPVAPLSPEERELRRLGRPLRKHRREDDLRREF